MGNQRGYSNSTIVVTDAAVARGIEVIDVCMDDIASELTTAETAAARDHCSKANYLLIIALLSK